MKLYENHEDPNNWTKEEIISSKNLLENFCVNLLMIFSLEDDYKHVSISSQYRNKFTVMSEKDQQTFLQVRNSLIGDEDKILRLGAMFHIQIPETKILMSDGMGDFLWNDAIKIKKKLEDLQSQFRWYMPLRKSIMSILNRSITFKIAIPIGVSLFIYKVTDWCFAGAIGGFIADKLQWIWK